MRAWILISGVAALTAAAGVAGAAAFGAGDEPPAETGEASTEAEATTVEVVRGDLARVEDLDGSVGHGEATPLVLTAEGTLTALPAAGDVIEPGGVVAEIDGLPIIALQGAFPLWRTLGPGVDDGKDVLQVEHILASLGYAQQYDVTVDDDWTWATTEAVEAFQKDYGQDDDGEIDLGEIVTIPGPLRVDDVTGVAGQQATEAGISVTSREQSVHLDLDAADADLLAVDDQVEVELPTGETTTATVTTIGAAQTDAEDATTLPVTLTLSAAPRSPTAHPSTCTSRSPPRPAWSPSLWRPCWRSPRAATPSKSSRATVPQRPRASSA